MKKMTQGATRLLVLALGLGLASTGWAANAPTATVSGTSVTISNESGAESWDNAGINDMSGYQGKNFTIPAIGTDLPSGTILKITSVSVAKSTSQTYMPDKLGLSGCVSSYRTITSGGFTLASADKYTYSFVDTDCLIKVGTATPIRFYQNSGAEHNSTIAFRLGANAYQFIASIVWGGKVPIIEIQAEIVSGFVNSTSGSGQSDWGFESGSGSGKVYLSGYGNYLKTPGSNEKEIVLVDGTYGYGLKVINGNSTTASGNVNGTIFTKLSGTGTLTTDYNGNSGVKSVIQVYDSSDFSGAIQTGFSAGPKASVVFRNSGETLPDTLYNLVVATTPAQIYVSAGKTGANAITIPAGKTWQASMLCNCGETIINGTFSGPIVNSGTLTINGTVTGSVANSGSGTVTVNAGATLASFGSVRDFTGFSVNSSVPVKITMSAEEYGKGSLSISGASGISSITVLAPDGTTTVGTITPVEGAGTLDTGIKTSGLATWCDYEMNGDLDNTGVNSDKLNYNGSDENNSFYNSSMLYTYTHPWRDISYPSTWTAVVRCTVPKVPNGAVITFGTCSDGLIGLLAGDDPETQMKLVKTTGNSAYTKLADMDIVNGTSAQHVYVFVVENNSTVKVYCDGSEVLNQTYSAFTLGGGIQVGSVHGGINATGITRVWKGDTYAGLTEDDLKDARIDCVRLYDYSLSAAQIAALSVEFPAVKLYRATVAANANTDWGSLTWTPAWDGGNASSKIILTVEGDASLTLTNSITADEFVINVPSANVLTLSKFASGTTLAVTEPIEVSGGTIYFNPGISQPIGLGDLNFGGTGTIRLGNGTLVNNNISGTANVELLSGVSAIMYGGAISNPLKGAGLLDYSYGNSLPSGLSFGDWTGTVKLPGFTADALNLNNYGKSGSTVEITAINGGWIAEAGRAIAPTLKLSGNMTIDAMSSWTYTFAEITGSGNLSFSTSANSPTVNITKVAEGYSGTISSTLSNPVTITTLDRAAETPVTAGSKLLNTSSGVQASALTLAGVATSISPVFDTDGLYVKAASVTKNDATVNYDTVSAAMTAAGNDAATIKLLMPTDSAIALAPGQTLLNGNLTSGTVSGSADGVEVINNGGTYTVVDNRTSTWSPGAESDNNWATAANWSTGRVPTQYTTVTFPSAGAPWTVNVPNDSGDAKCAAMVLDGNTTVAYTGGSWAALWIYGGVTGDGVLTLDECGLRNKSGSAVTIATPVVSTASDNCYLAEGAFTFSDSVTVSAGQLKAEYTAATFGGTVTINNSANIKANGSGSSLVFNGGIDVPENASAALQIYDGAITIASTVTLASGATLTVPNSATVSGATFATSVADSYVKTAVGGSTTEYSVAAKRTVTVSVGPHSSVSGVVDGQKFVPGDVLTITASADTYYTPALTVNGDAQTSPYELTTTDADVTVAVTATLDTYTITIPSVANTTVSISYTSGGEAQVATSAGAITVDAGTSLTATWTAVSGYQITANAEQTINSVVATQTLTSPTVEEMSAVVSNVNFTYGADYTTAEVTATISGEATSATLTYGGNTYNAQVSNGTATFTDVAVSRDSGNIYAPVSYTITTDAHATTGGSGSAVAADTTAWFSQSSANLGAPLGGSWATDVNLSTPTNVTDNTFAATAPSTSSRVVLEFEVCFSSTSEEDVSGEAQAAIKLGEENSVTTFMVLTNGNEWAAVSAAGFVPNVSETYKVVLTIDYVSNTYKVDVEGHSMTNVAGAASFPLAANRSSVQNIDFAGSGTLKSLKGDQVEGYMVVDNNGKRYPSIAAAISAYTQDPSIGPLKLLHSGTAPSGWRIDGDTLIKVAKGLFFMAY